MSVLSHSICTHSVSSLKKGTYKQSFILLKGLAFCCEQLPPYFLGRAGVGKKIGVLFPKTTNLMTLL